jgi:hypothetical protein
MQAVADMAAAMGGVTTEEALRLEGVLGQGSYGLVYRGTWKGLEVRAPVMFILCCMLTCQWQDHLPAWSNALL